MGATGCRVVPPLATIEQVAELQGRIETRLHRFVDCVARPPLDTIPPVFTTLLKYAWCRRNHSGTGSDHWHW